MALNLLQMKTEFPDPMRQGAVDMLWQNSRVMQYVFFIEHSGLSYPYTKRKSLPGVGFRSLNSTFTRTVGVINPDIEPLSVLGGAIRTDSIQIILKGDKARTNEIGAQMIAAAKFFDKSFFNGGASVDVNGFPGLQTRLGGTQLLTNADNGAIVALDKVIELQDRVNGDNAQKILFMNQTNRRNLVKSAMETTALNTARYIEYRNGVLYFNGSQVVEVYFDEAETAILGFTEACGNQSASSSIYCVQFGGAVDENGVQGISGLPGKIQATGPFNYGEYMEDIVQMVVGIGLFGGYVAARLQGCNAA